MCLNFSSYIQNGEIRTIELVVICYSPSLRPKFEFNPIELLLLLRQEEGGGVIELENEREGAAPNTRTKDVIIIKIGSSKNWFFSPRLGRVGAE